MKVKELAEVLGYSEERIRQVVKELGYSKGQGAAVDLNEERVSNVMDNLLSPKLRQLLQSFVKNRTSAFADVKNLTSKNLEVKNLTKESEFTSEQKLAATAIVSLMSTDSKKYESICSRIAKKAGIESVNYNLALADIDSRFVAPSEREKLELEVLGAVVDRNERFNRMRIEHIVYPASERELKYLPDEDDDE